MDIGKLFVFGFEGKRPTKAMIDFIRHEKIAGVILFKKNFETPEQIQDLTAELQDISGGELLIGIDEEGGRVANLPKSIIEIPAMGKLGDDFSKDKNLEIVKNLGAEIGETLLSYGFNLNFAPVLDVNTNEKNPIIGNRSFGSDPEIVATLGSEMWRAMSEGGIITCGKHFPGHGDTSEDSHKSLPRLSHGMGRLNEIDLVPFRRAIEDGIPSLMNAHIIYEGVDQGVPATLSKKILTDLLRTELGFKGVLFSDDMEMDAIAENFKFDYAVTEAINAGCDVLLVCRTEERQYVAIDAAKKRADQDESFAARVSESNERVRSLVTQDPTSKLL